MFNYYLLFICCCNQFYSKW